MLKRIVELSLKSRGIVVVLARLLDRVPCLFSYRFEPEGGT